MLSPAEIDAYRSTITPPALHENVLDADQISALTTMYETFLADPLWQERDWMHRGKGRYADVTVFHDWNNNEPLRAMLGPIIERVHGGPFQINGGSFYNVISPYVIHTDNRRNEPGKRYRVMIFPLRVSVPDTHVVLFRQYATGTRARFLGGEQPPEQVVSQRQQKFPYPKIYDYRDEVLFLDEGDPLTPEWHQRHLAHLPYSNLQGLTLDCLLPFNPGSLMVFDQRCLHCSEDFNSLGMPEKLGLTLFVTDPD